MTDTRHRLFSGAKVQLIDDDLIWKTGSRVRPNEEQALLLVAQHTTVPVPSVECANFQRSDRGELGMSLIPGVTLDKCWDSLDEVTKSRICRDIWALINEMRKVPKPPELSHLFVCGADGSQSNDILVKDLGDPQPLFDDNNGRNRIYERYYYYVGRRYSKEEILEMLPRSSRSAFTHGDIAPRNIMVEEENLNITGIIDWEMAG